MKHLVVSHRMGWFVFAVGLVLLCSVEKSEGQGGKKQQQKAGKDQKKCGKDQQNQGGIQAQQLQQGGSKGKAKGHHKGHHKENHQEINSAALQNQQLLEFMMQQFAQLNLGPAPLAVGNRAGPGGQAALPGNPGQGAQAQGQFGNQPQAAAMIGMRGGGFRPLPNMQRDLQAGAGAAPNQPNNKQALPGKKKK